MWAIAGYALAASLLLLVGGTAGHFLTRRSVQSDGPTAKAPPIPSVENIIRVEGRNRLVIELAYNPMWVKEIRSRTGTEPGAPFTVHYTDPNGNTNEWKTLKWESAPLSFTGGYKPIHPTVEIVPRSEYVDRFENVGPDGVIRYQRDLLLTPNGIEEKLTELEHLVDELGLNKVVRVAPEGPFRVVGNRVLRAELEINRAYVHQVALSWGENDLEKVIYSGPDQPFTMGGLHTVSSSFTPPRKETGYKVIKPNLKIIFYPEMKQRLGALVDGVRTEYQEEVVITPFGLTVAPDILPKPSLNQIQYAGNKDTPNLYLITGQAYQQSTAPPIGYLIIAPALSTNGFVGAKISLSPDGLFATRCYLGTKIDNERYSIYLVVANRDDPKPFEELDQIPPGFDWEKAGYLRSDTRQKTNDGKDTFDIR